MQGVGFTTVFLRDRHIACRVQIGDGRGSCHVAKMLKYTMVSTLQKLRSDPSPYFSPGFAVPQKVLNLRSKAFASFAGKPATHQEVYEYVCQAEDLNSYENFEDYVDNGRRNVPGDIRFARLSKFPPRNAKDARYPVTLFSERRNREMNKEIHQKLEFFHGRAVAKCLRVSRRAWARK